MSKLQAATWLVLAATGVLGAAAAVSGCTAAPPPAATSAVPNPVDVLRKLPGIQIPPAAAAGTLDAAGNRSASGEVGGGPVRDRVTVYAGADLSAELAANALQSDGEFLVSGPGWLLVYWASLPGQAPPALTAAQVAAATGGHPVAQQPPPDTTA